MRRNRTRTILIILSFIAAALGVLAAIIVFYPVGSYQEITPQRGPSTSNTSSFNRTSSTGNAFASSTPGMTTSGAGNPTSTQTNVAGRFASDYSPPYAINWMDGKEQFAVTGASLRDGELMISLAIQMGNVSECVPVNVRLVSDESGTLRAPDAPSGGTFAFPDTQTCNGSPGALYSESLVWKIGSVASPFLLTTGGASNIFFTVATSSSGGVDITLPSRSG